MEAKSLKWVVCEYLGYQVDGPEFSTIGIFSEPSLADVACTKDNHFVSLHELSESEFNDEQNLNLQPALNTDKWVFPRIEELFPSVIEVTPDGCISMIVTSVKHISFMNLDGITKTTLEL